MNVTKKTALVVRSATTVGLGNWYTKQLTPKTISTLINDDIRAMRKLRQRRLSITRIPSIYLSNLAEKTLGEIK